jgi:GWxTD domain-containing protein
MKTFDFLIIWLTCFIFFIVKIPAFTQSDFSNKNLSWKYDLENIYQVNYRIALYDSLYYIYFSVNLPEGIDIEDQLSIDYDIKSSLEAEEIILSRTINYPVHGAGMDKESKYFHFRIPNVNNYFILLLHIKNNVSGNTYTHNIPLVSETIYPPPDFMLFKKTSDLPVCRDYIHRTDSLFIQNYGGEKREFFVYYYKTEFDAADPPMYRLKKAVSKSMEIDSTFMINTDSAFIPGKEGLYFIQSDTSNLSGIGIRIENDFYPKMTSIKQLIDPLVYLSTKEEIDKLLNAEDVRSSFESFWLNLAKSEQMAKSIIKKYYNRIEESNSLFTNYKEGWKTDMGMVYCILGPPDEVYISEGNESWNYKNPSKNQVVVFNFLHLKNLFSDKQYMLIRDNQYKSFWFNQIDRWRKGIN